MIHLYILAPFSYVGHVLSTLFSFLFHIFIRSGDSRRDIFGERYDFDSSRAGRPFKSSQSWGFNDNSPKRSKQLGRYNDNLGDHFQGSSFNSNPSHVPLKRGNRKFELPPYPEEYEVDQEKEEEERKFSPDYDKSWKPFPERSTSYLPTPPRESSMYQFRGPTRLPGRFSDNYQTRHDREKDNLYNLSEDEYSDDDDLLYNRQQSTPFHYSNLERMDLGDGMEDEDIVMLEDGSLSRRSKEEQTMRESLERLGYRLSPTDIAFDGNCQFTSVSDQLSGYKGVGYHKTIRKEVIKWIRRHKDTRFPNGVRIRDYVFDEDFDKFLERMSKDGEWGNELTLRAICEIYNTNITIISTGIMNTHELSNEKSKTKGEVLEMTPMREKASQTVYLAFYSRMYHYASVIPNRNGLSSSLPRSYGVKKTGGNLFSDMVDEI